MTVRKRKSIKQRAAAVGLSLEDLARLMEVGRSTIYRWNEDKQLSRKRWVLVEYALAPLEEAQEKRHG